MWQAVTSFENLLCACRSAAKGKRRRPDVARFEFDLEENIFKLHKVLIEGSYRHDPYHSFYIHDPKRRLISAASFKDRVVHHALCRQIEPLFERKFIHDTYANRAGKGTHRALDRCTQYLRSYDYYLQMDIRQYFPSIDHQILIKTLSEEVQESNVLNLCREILGSGVGVLDNDYVMVTFPGDDLFARVRPRGLPIGNLTSQFWGNVYLNKLDHFIKRRLKCPGYIRYVDDMLFFSSSKPHLHDIWAAVVDFLAGLRLTVHQKHSQPTAVRHGVTFLGFRCFPTHRRLKRVKAVHARRKIKAAWAEVRSGQTIMVDFNERMQSWISHAEYGDTWGLRTSILDDCGLLAEGEEFERITDIHQNL
jgi:RNA-directed DNA polymerase